MQYKTEIVIKNEKLIVWTYTMPVGSVIKPIKPTEPVPDVSMRNKGLGSDYGLGYWPVDIEFSGTVIKQQIRSMTRNYEFFNEPKVKEYLNENNFTMEKDVHHIAPFGRTYPIIYSRTIPISTLSNLKEEVKNLHDTLVNELNTLISELTGSVSTEESTDTTPISSESNESKITTSSVIISVLICVFILLIILSFYMKGK